MKDEWELVEEHLYRRRHQKKDGDWVIRYYGRFVDHTGKRRRFALGKDLEKARRKLGTHKTRNDAEFDFDKEKRERAAQALTFADWADEFLEVQKALIRKAGEAQRKGDKKIASSTHERDLQLLKHLNRTFGGGMALADIKADDIEAFKAARRGEKIIRDGKQSTVAVSESEIASELSLLRKLLKAAAAKDRIAKAPGMDVPKKSERTRVLKDWEYKKLLVASPAWFKRLQVFAYETCVGQGDLLRLKSGRTSTRS